ncbi:unnamed protein product, partial [marine sediment metagenome]
MTVEAPRGKTSLRLETWSDAVRRLFLNGLAGDLPFSFEHVTNADRSLKVEDFTLSEYNLVIPDILSVQPKMPSIFSFNGVIPVKRGQCYARVTLLFQDKQIAILSSAYVTDAKGITYPPGVHEGFTEGPGHLYSVAFPVPAFGAELSLEVPENVRWRVRAIYILLITDEAVFDRAVRVVFNLAYQLDYIVPDVVAQTASTTMMYYLGKNGETHIGTVDPLMVAMKLPDIVLEGGNTIETLTVDLQEGDRYA